MEDPILLRLAPPVLVLAALLCLAHALRAPRRPDPPPRGTWLLALWGLAASTALLNTLTHAWPLLMAAVFPATLLALGHSLGLARQRSVSYVLMGLGLVLWGILFAARHEWIT